MIDIGGFEMDDESLDVESKIETPDLSCPKCGGLLPAQLGEIECVLCDAHVKVDHPPTRRAWVAEKIRCKTCSSLLLVGVDKRPANLQCSSCESQFIVTPHIPKAEVQCPSCDRKMRLSKRPGSRQISCPACSISFKVSF